MANRIRYKQDKHLTDEELRALGYDDEDIEIHRIEEDLKAKGINYYSKGCDEYDGALERYLDMLPDDDPIFK